MGYLAEVPDPRMARLKDHPLVNVLDIALLAVLCGADTFTAMTEQSSANSERMPNREGNSHRNR